MEIDFYNKLKMILICRPIFKGLSESDASRPP